MVSLKTSVKAEAANLVASKGLGLEDSDRELLDKWAEKAILELEQHMNAEGELLVSPQQKCGYDHAKRVGVSFLRGENK